jgi:hypothetical protein
MAERLMTYAELAEVWGVSKEAARKKVEGLRLPKQMGNDGRARVMIDLTEVQHEPMKPRSDRRPDGDQPETPPDVADLRRLAYTLETEVERITALATSNRADYERERDRADTLVTELSAIRATLEAALVERDAERARGAQVEVLTALMEAERRRAEELRIERDRWQEEATRPRGLLALFRRRA